MRGRLIDRTEREREGSIDRLKVLEWYFLSKFCYFPIE